MFNKEAEFEKEVEFEKEAKECEDNKDNDHCADNDYCADNKDNDYCADRIIQQTYQQVTETGYSRATGDAKRIIYNLLDVLMYLEGGRVAEMDIVKEAQQYLKEA